MAIAIHAAEVSIKNGQTHIDVREQITPQEKSALLSENEFVKNLLPVKLSYRIMQKNAHEYLDFMQADNLWKCYVSSGNRIDVVEKANRLLYNFCASIETFISYTKIASKKKGKHAGELIERFCSALFDSHFEYRFFYKLRNCVIHYSYPYMNVRVSRSTISLNCSKQHLLKYDGWGAIVSKDLVAMEEDIDICKYVEKELAVLKEVYEAAYYFYAHDINNAHNTLQGFCKKYQLSSPIIIQIQDCDMTKPHTLHPIPIEEIMEGMQVLRQHPRTKFVPAITK